MNSQLEKDLESIYNQENQLNNNCIVLDEVIEENLESLKTIFKDDNAFNYTIDMSNEEISNGLYKDQFFNSYLYKLVKERCEKEPDKTLTIIFNQGMISDEEVRARMEYFEYLRQSKMIPNNLKFSFCVCEKNEEHGKVR